MCSYFVVLLEISVAFSTRVHVLVYKLLVYSCILEILSHCISTNVVLFSFLSLLVVNRLLCAEPASYLVSVLYLNGIATMAGCDVTEGCTFFCE